MTRPHVFISSTSDLAEERQSVAAALRPRFEPYLYEDDRAGRQSPEKRCRGMIVKSDLVVGLLGGAYGTPFPAKGESRSIVEWELDEARRTDGLEIFAFVKKPDALTTSDERQKQFLGRLGSFQAGLWLKEFRSTEQLVSLVLESVDAWLAELVVRMRRWERERAPRLRRRLFGLGAVVGLGGAAAMGLAWVGAITPGAAMVAAGSLAVAAAMSAVLLARETGGGGDDEGK